MSLKYLAGEKSRTVFCPVNLDGALELVDTWEQKLSPLSPEAADIKRYLTSFKFNVKYDNGNRKELLPLSIKRSPLF